MEAVLPSVDKVIIEEGTTQVLPYLLPEDEHAGSAVGGRKPQTGGGAMRRAILLLLLIGAVAPWGLTVLGSFGWGPVLITREGEQKILLMFGKALAVTTPGVFARVPLLMDVETYPSLKLYLNVDPESIQTKDQERIVIDNYVVWRIVDPVEFRGSFPQGIELAKQQINRVVKAAVREIVGKRTLLDVLTSERENIRLAITGRTANSLVDDGIEIDDVRINRTELPSATEKNVFARMKTDRERLARKYRAEGEEKARTIRADAEREARVTVANARKLSRDRPGRGRRRGGADLRRGLLDGPRVLRLPADDGGLPQDDR